MISQIIENNKLQNMTHVEFLNNMHQMNEIINLNDYSNKLNYKYYINKLYSRKYCLIIISYLLYNYIMYFNI